DRVGDTPGGLERDRALLPGRPDHRRRHLSGRAGGGRGLFQMRHCPISDGQAHRRYAFHKRGLRARSSAEAAGRAGLGVSAQTTEATTMKLASFKANGRVSYGAVTGTGIIDLGRKLKYPTLLEVLRAGALGEARAAAAGAADHQLKDVEMLPPIL